MNTSWSTMFYDFCGELTVETKDHGKLRLADNLLGSQKMFVDQVCSGLDNDIHSFVVTKARQLGISTISLAMVDLFWPMVHDGMQGAIITDTEGNRDKFRIIIDQLIDGLPSKMRVGVKTNNRSNLVFKNGSVLDYMVAGKRKNSGLGRSRALNMLHATECSSWGDPQGVESLKAALSEKHPNRIFVYESTALGFNLFWNMWKNAEGDPDTQKAIFLGWWSKASYSIKKGTKTWERFWDGRLTDTERDLMKQVDEKYGYQMSTEQIVWYRWKSANQIGTEQDLQQEYPWTAEQAFVATGRGFFNRRQITKHIHDIHDNKPIYQAYKYHFGDDFLTTDVEDLYKSVERGDHVTVDDMELKIYHQPDSRGSYVIGVDPAYGRSDNKDRHCIQVWRCYADRLIQCAEFCTDNYESKQCAWAMCHLAGMYKNTLINYEINGPGNILKIELEHLQQLLTAGYLNNRATDAGMKDFFSAVSWYLYNKPDSMGAGFAYGFSTTANTKFMIMNQMRDSYSSNYLDINSLELLEEMQTLIQDGSAIEASGNNKDDRVFATALAIEAWVKWIRPSMIASNKTYAIVTEEENAEPGKMQSFVAGIVQDTFQRKSMERQKELMQEGWE